ncbi:MAG TPA: RluA family pseudouridine synthase [Tepidisphaeraceae bacterium]|jgi:23S rRNA pseudouridine1911/1915/1917 synthase|nr:RluA family pseudouridine synthase [Tepidisphaeraceae bacterium]
MQRTLLDALIERFPAAKRLTLRRMIEDRRVRVDGKIALKAKLLVERDQTIVVEDSRIGKKAAEPSLPFRVVHEDADVIVIDKPTGLLTSTVPREKRPTALAILRDYFARREPSARVGLIHRLDRDASGLLVFSKTHEAFRLLKEQFFKHTVDRVYTAVVYGKLKPAEGRIDSRLVELPDGSVHSTKRKDHGERAISDYQVLRTAGDLSLVRVTLFTGRKHQIRVHLAEHRTPILGDPMYGSKDAPGASRLLLAATALSFAHPHDGKRMRFELDLLPEMRRLFQ